MYCEIGDCLERAERSSRDGRRLCAGHRKQVQRNGHAVPLIERPRSARERLFEAAIDLRDADAEDDQGYRNAERRFWHAFRAAAQEYLAGQCAAARDGLSPEARITRRR